jgi:uncharacterized protein
MAIVPRPTADVGVEGRRITRRAAIVTGAAVMGTGLLWKTPALAAPKPEATEPNPVTPAATAVLAVLGTFPQGPVNEAVEVTSWGEFERRFGVVEPRLPFGTEPSMAVYAVYQFFLGGGSTAFIVGLNASSADSLVTAVLAQVVEPESSSAPAPALDRIAPGFFNIMCIPDLALVSNAEQASVIAAAQRFCKARQAFLIVDPPPPLAAMTNPWLSGADAVAVDDIGTSDGMTRLQNWAAQLINPDCDATAAYYPWVQIPDPWNNSAPRYVPPSGTVSGVYATTDDNTGVWKAPAGMGATLTGVTGLADLTITDTVNDILNVHGINCLRTFAGERMVVWGARTLAGVSNGAFTYVTTRRLADLIQQSLQQSLKWTVFEPNGPPLWSSLAFATNTFMAMLWREGAVFGASPTQAFNVSCDATTTSAADIKAGIVNISVALAPVHPAEFVVLNIPLRAGSPTTS